jgi:hypothetical protein
VRRVAGSHRTPRSLLGSMYHFTRFLSRADRNGSHMSAQRSALARSLAFKNYTQGISAGAKGAKYKTKYRELKKKVKDIGTMSQPDAVFV